jgi:flagellar hook assembly protein FlgD
VFPNPVKPGYTGNIAFTDLTNDSYVRVTDQTGNLIYETTSFGGQAIWDGKNRSGQRVPSGVYLIFAATREGTGGQVGKIMILN